MARPEVTGRKFVSKRAVADRYDVVIRTIDRWVKAGILPVPDLVINHRDYWHEESLDRHDRAAVVARAAAKDLPAQPTTVAAAAPATDSVESPAPPPRKRAAAPRQAGQAQP
jgi:hypothetical protein